MWQPDVRVGHKGKGHTFGMRDGMRDGVRDGDERDDGMKEMGGG